jgi:hypothetical protein
LLWQPQKRRTAVYISMHAGSYHLDALRSYLPAVGVWFGCVTLWRCWCQTVRGVLGQSCAPFVFHLREESAAWRLWSMPGICGCCSINDSMQ